MSASRLLVSSSVLLSSIFCGHAVYAAGTCGSGGVVGEQVQVEYNGSLYYITTPEDYSDDQPWPLIFGLHGDEGDPDSSVNWFWRDVPDGSFVFVAPKAPNASGSWYEEQESNEEWMDGLYDSIRAQYNIDLDRTYIWGLSGGAVFSSRYVAARQDVIAAAQFNMGGSGTWNYVAPPTPECKIKARWSVSDTDFLVDGARDYYDMLTDNGHTTEWVSANCEGHCWEEESMEGQARDWLLSHTLCDRTPTPQCDGEPPPPDPGPDPDPTDPSGTGGSADPGTNPDGSPTVPGDGDSTGSGAPGDGNAGSGTGMTGDVSDDGPMKGAVADEAGGCSVGPLRSNTNWAPWLAALLALGLARRRRDPIRI